MTVHMFKICAGPQSSWPQADANFAIEDWMSKQSEWEADTKAHSMTGKSDPAGSADWWGGQYRLTFASEPKANLLQKLRDKLVNKPLWWRFGYHPCSHDSDPAPACDWSEKREWTAKDATIPDAAPTFPNATLTQS